MSELLADLKGCNGRWKQAKAREEWERQMKLREVWENRRRAEAAELRRKKAEELENIRRQKELDIQRRLEEQERHRREAEERARQLALEEEKERLRLEEERRLWQLQQPRPCSTCGGSGECVSCSGRGYFLAMYLAPVVCQDSLSFHGRTQRGCEACGGDPHEHAERLTKGTGKCGTCTGTGKVVPTLPETKQSEIGRKRPSINTR